MSSYHYLAWLFIYSCLGWVYESTLCSITSKKLVNRGFLTGPICPIYGFGAILVIMVLSQIQNIGVLFFASMILTCSVEYFTSWLLEKLFHAKWWDYSRFRCQLNSRICLAGALVFGTLSVLLLKVIHPYIQSVIQNVSDSALIIIVTVLVIITAIDSVVTVIQILKLNGKLKEIQEVMDRFIEEAKAIAIELKETIPDRDIFSKELRETLGERITLPQDIIKEFKVIVEESKDMAIDIKISLREKIEQSGLYNNKIRELIRSANFQERRILNAFPRLKSHKYNEALQQLRDRVTQKISEWDREHHRD